MNVVLLYTGSDGESHLEDVDIELNPSTLDGGVTDLWPASAVRVRTIRSDYEMGFHVAPHRQLVVNLIGTSEIEVASGDRRVLGPGSILVVEDTTGRGHLARKTNGQPLTCMLVHLGNAELPFTRSASPTVS